MCGSLAALDILRSLPEVIETFARKKGRNFLDSLHETPAFDAYKCAPVFATVAQILVFYRLRFDGVESLMDFP